jgi:DNA modification methylase
LLVNNKPIRGFLFACTDKSEKECLDRLLFSTDKLYGPIVIRIRAGDLLFLNNLDQDTLLGIFIAESDGGFNIQPEAFNGRYPYQVKVKALGEVITAKKAKNLLHEFEVRRNTPLFGKKLIEFLDNFCSIPVVQGLLIREKFVDYWNPIQEIIKRIKNSNGKSDIEDEIPLIEATTFWDFPKQSYGLTPKGNNKYAGVTPALIIYNMIWRYTNPGDLVVDPMCGSGTTIDVCKEEKRRSICYDIHSTRGDIIQNDARHIPLENNSVDMVFIDSPYGDNIKYNDEPNNIGNISAESEEFYDELEKVMKECHRILKDDKALGWLIGDQWVRGMFTPVGFEIYTRLCKYFKPLDIICVNRRGQSSNTVMWLNRARRLNFYLRGFKYLIIVRKTSEQGKPKKSRKIEWAYYDRGVKNDRS